MAEIYGCATTAPRAVDSALMPEERPCRAASAMAASEGTAMSPVAATSLLAFGIGDPTGIYRCCGRRRRRA